MDRGRCWTHRVACISAAYIRLVGKALQRLLGSLVIFELCYEVMGLAEYDNRQPNVIPSLLPPNLLVKRTI
jgi:hypothetical protein